MQPLLPSTEQLPFALGAGTANICYTREVNKFLQFISHCFNLRNHANESKCHYLSEAKEESKSASHFHRFVDIDADLLPARLTRTSHVLSFLIGVKHRLSCTAHGLRILTARLYTT